MTRLQTRLAAACTSLAILAASGNAFAAQAIVGPVQLDSAGIVGGTAMQGHAAGNFEIKVTGGFNPSSKGLTNCIGNGANDYITTKMSNDPGGSMYETALEAVASHRTVTMWVTDDPALEAWGPGVTNNRCSLLSIGINW